MIKLVASRLLPQPTKATNVAFFSVREGDHSLSSTELEGDTSRLLLGEEGKWLPFSTEEESYRIWLPIITSSFFELLSKIAINDEIVTNNLLTIG